MNPLHEIIIQIAAYFIHYNITIITIQKHRFLSRNKTTKIDNKLNKKKRE